MGTLSIKSLLTSLCQREAISPSLAKRGKGRFSGQCGFTYEPLSKYYNHYYFTSVNDRLQLRN